MLWERPGSGLGPCTIPENWQECQLLPRDSPGVLPLLPACWVLGEATGFRDFPGLRRGDSPAETGRERDQERQRHREGETDKEEEIVKEITVRDGSRGEKRGEATDRLTQEIRGGETEIRKQHMRDSEK